MMPVLSGCAQMISRHAMKTEAEHVLVFAKTLLTDEPILVDLKEYLA